MDGQTTGTMTGGAVAPAVTGAGSANAGGGATGAQAAESANPGSQGGRASGTGGEPGGGETALAAMKEIFSQGNGVKTDGDARPDGDAAKSGGETAKSGETGAREAGDGKADGKQEAGDGKQEAGDGKNGAGGAAEAVDPLDQPITDWEKVEIEGEFDPQILKEFGAKAVALGLTARQAQTLAQFELEAARAARERILDAGTRELQAEWGGDFQARCKSVLGLFSNIDRALGDSSFSEALNASGAACHPAFIRGMARVAELLEEDSLAARHGGALAAREETPYEGLARIFGPGKRRQG